MSADRSPKHSLGTRIAAGVGIVASVVGIATGLKSLLGDDGPPKEPANEVSARQVRECIRDHGLRQARQKREPAAGESDIAAPDPMPEFAIFEQRTYASCSWPAPPGADPDGYRAVTATTVDGPGENEATGTNYAERIESHCEVVEIDVLHGSMGSFEHLAPVRGRPGEVVMLTTIPREGSTGLTSGLRPWSPGRFGDGEATSLPFYPERDELVVLHNGKNVIEDLRCAS